MNSLFYKKYISEKQKNKHLIEHNLKLVDSIEWYQQMYSKMDRELKKYEKKYGMGARYFLHQPYNKLQLIIRRIFRIT